jgi:cytochrome P450
MLVGSIDTTASSVAKTIAVISRDRELGSRVAADVHDEERLAGWCWKALRRCPDNPIVLLQALAPTQLGDVNIEQGDQIIVWTQAAMLDPSAFTSPHELRPDRSRGASLHFGAGLHPCAANCERLPNPAARRSTRQTGNQIGRSHAMGRPFPSHLPPRMRAVNS